MKYVLNTSVILFVLALSVLSSPMSFAQVVGGIKLGGSYYSKVKPERVDINDNITQIKLYEGQIIEDNWTSPYAGLFGRFYLEPMYLQTELMFEYRSSSYEYTPLIGAATIEEFKAYQLEVPIVLGLEIFNTVHVHGGIVSSIYFSDIEYGPTTKADDAFDRLHVGWRLGGGAKIWKFLLDFNVDGNFLERDHRVYIGDNSGRLTYDYMRFSLTLGYIFKKPAE